MREGTTHVHVIAHLETWLDAEIHTGRCPCKHCKEMLCVCPRALTLMLSRAWLGAPAYERSALTLVTVDSWLLKTGRPCMSSANSFHLDQPNKLN